jgi:hypothetical protein
MSEDVEHYGEGDGVPVDGNNGKSHKKLPAGALHEI